MFVQQKIRYFTWLTLSVFVLIYLVDRHKLNTNSMNQNVMRPNRTRLPSSRKAGANYSRFNTQDTHLEVVESDKFSVNETDEQLSESPLQTPAIGPAASSSSVEITTPRMDLDGSSPRRKVVLLWTGLYRSKYFMFGAGSEPFVEKCPAHESNCLTTADQADMSQADAVVFFMFPIGARLWEQNISARLPARGRQGQVYVFWNDEPPVYATYEKLYGLEGVFNATVTYRLDSTIPLPVYHLEAMPDDEFPPPTNWSEVLSKKTKLVAWVVSACKKTHSQRLRYVQVLQEYIPIDVYGRCGNLTLENCSGYHCFEALQTSYKFYLAFENSICSDYITEKVYRTLDESWVPVILGGGDYQSRLPPHSYIDVNDFASPKHLAEHLLYLDQNDREYLRYFEQKRRYKVIRRDTKQAFCKLCGMLNNNSSTKFEQNLDIHKWWQVGACVPYDKVPEHLHLE